ncbi:PAS domain S-box protein, partial [Candidatus Pacearchaeota archaeon]|nr:PAS domain S-box protein [Candidatus Pacearchaeota archaeon]
KSLNGKVKKIRYTFRGLRKDGSEIDCEVYNRLIKYIGKPAILGTCLDITEQKKAEKELLESEEKFRVLAEQSPNMIFINKNSRVLYCNKRCEELMGYTTEEFCSPEFDFFSLIVPVDVELVKKNFKKYKKGCDIEPFEYTLLTKVGQKIEVIINARLIKYEREESILCVVTDITKRKQAEETLIKSESQLQAFFNNAAVGISVADPNGQYIKVNNHYLEMFGYKDELELFKKTVGENTYPEDRQSTRKAQQDLASGRIDFIRLEKRYIRKDGSIFWGDISASPIHDPDGKIRAFVAIINDISERKQVEVSLQFTQFAIDRNADAAFWMGEDARVIYVNEAACRSLGYSKEELLTMTVHEIDPDFPAEVWPDHWKDLRKRGSFTIQSHHRTKEGQVFPVEIQLNFVRFEGKEYNCAFARNITEHKKTEEALRESEKKFRDLVNLLPQTVFEVDLVGNFTFANQHGFKTFLYTQEDLDKGLNALKMFVPEDRDRGKYNFRKILAGKKVESQKYTGLKKDGNTFPVVIYSSPIIRENQPVGIRGIVVDISERRELEMKLKNVAREWNITFDAIKDPIALLDINRKIKRCNKAQMDFLNKPFKKILDNAVYELVHGDKKTPEDCPFQRMLESKQRESSEQKKKNSWLRCTVDPIFDDSGEIIGAVHIISDISESKQAEIRITKQSEFMNIILESLTHPFYIIDTSNYQIVMSNPAANQFDLADYSTCYRLTHMQEQPCNGINHPCPIKEIQKNKKPVNVEHVHFDKKGNKKNFDIYAYPIFDEKNNVIQIIEYSIDITERRRAEESAKKQYQQLLQADK